MVQQKWQCVKRNLRVGNVIVQDQNTIKGTWKLAEVYNMIPSSDGKVRDVEISYKIQKENGDYDGQQDIRAYRSQISSYITRWRAIISGRWECHTMLESYIE